MLFISIQIFLHLQMGLSVVDEVGKQPPMEKDMFWEDPQPEPLYSSDSAGAHMNPLVGSAAKNECVFRCIILFVTGFRCSINHRVSTLSHSIYFMEN